MKKDKGKKQLSALFFAVAAAAILAGCGAAKENGRESSSVEESAEDGAVPAGAASLEVRFGDEGAPFVINLEQNAAAAGIAEYVGTADWRLPIDHYDDYEDWEVMQYYDIPSRYEISGDAETVTSEKAGEVYYSEPNRIILFYQDGEITGEYTKIGTIENTEEFREAVEQNPVLEGWGNKIILINSME